MASVNDHERHTMIRNMLKIKGLSFSTLSREHEVTVSTISLVSRGRAKSERLEVILASAIGLTRQELWPERAVRNKKEAQMT